MAGTYNLKLDIGADVAVISKQEYLSKQDGPLTQTNKALSGPLAKGRFMGVLHKFIPDKLFMFLNWNVGHLETAAATQ